MEDNRSKSKYDFETMQKKYHMLTIIEPPKSIRTKNGSPTRSVLCECECGEKVTVNLYNLIGGNAQSCGCVRKCPGTTGNREDLKINMIDICLSCTETKCNGSCSYKEIKEKAKNRKVVGDSGNNT
jgi:hypothetical protein